MDDVSRVIEILAYSGAGVVVGFVVGFAARQIVRDLKNDVAETRREAETALVTADDAKNLAWEAHDEAEALKA